MKPSGSLGFIIPNSWLEGQYFSQMRNAVYNKNVCELVYLKDTVFQEVVETMILLCDNVDGSDGKIKLSTDVIKGEVQVIEFERERFVKGFNPFITLENPLLEKLQTKFSKLGDAAIVYRGLETRDNKKWLSEFRETDLHVPILLGRDVSRYNHFHSGTFVKFIKKEMKSNANELMYQQSKILMRRTGATIIATLEHENLIALKNLYLIIPNNVKEIYAMIAQINSRLMAYFHKGKSSGENKAFAQFKGFYVESFPYVKSENAFFKERVNLIVEITSRLNKLQIQFTDLLQSKFDLENLSKKLQNWYELEFKDLLKELRKTKVTLGLAEEAEWMKYFNEQKQKAEQLKTEMNRIDNEIDQMVYELYGLTEEEIKVIEES